IPQIQFNPQLLICIPANTSMKAMINTIGEINTNHCHDFKRFIKTTYCYLVVPISSLYLITISFTSILMTSPGLLVGIKSLQSVA
ncbi:MAG: hypothetical protein ACKO4R_10780, partial [Synechococcales cyanobacterium]